MGFLRELVSSVGRQFGSDGEEVYRVFSGQLYVFLVIAVPTLGLLLLNQRRRYRLGRVPRVLSRPFVLDLAVGATVLGILLVTLSAKPNPHPKVDLIPLHPLWTALTGSVDATRVATLFGANVVLFVPLGILLPLRWPRLNNGWVVVLVSAVLSGAIETLQYFMDRGRVTQLDDVIFNTLGGLLGWMALRAGSWVRQTAA
ncbi:MAG TPA: VanZ family protein [Actinomycetota bacterium]|nr:VanZ family protein [Actinomycetota bacterium]